MATSLVLAVRQHYQMQSLRLVGAMLTCHRSGKFLNQISEPYTECCFPTVASRIEAGSWHPMSQVGAADALSTASDDGTSIGLIIGSEFGRAHLELIQMFIRIEPHVQDCADARLTTLSPHVPQ